MNWNESGHGNFLWGAATSSHQVEGGNIHNDWWAWEQKGHIEGGAGSGQATDHWNRMAEDMRLAADLGLNSYRFSVEWSRIEPEEGRWDPTAEERYLELLAECEKNNLVPMLTLHHFTSPRWLAEKGGFAWEGAADAFARFVARVAKTLGPYVPLWCTLNEPMVLVSGTYLARIMPPAEFDPRKASRACRELLRCHVKAYDILHGEVPERKGRFRDRPLAVGLAHNMIDFMADRPWHPIERVLAGAFDRFYNRAWLDAVTGGPQRFGIPFLLPKAAPVPEALGRRTVDFIGVNYYTKGYAQWRPRDAAAERPAELPLGLAFARRKEPASDMEWAVHPEGLGKMLKRVNRYGLPVHVTENGIADRDDRLRPLYILEHLEQVARARQAGVPVESYYYWSLLDNFEWIKGFGPRFGLYKVDFNTFERSPTGSAGLLRKIIEAHLGDAPNLDILKRFEVSNREGKEHDG